MPSSTWERTPHWRRVLHLMEGLRGNWSEGRSSDMLHLLYVEIELARQEAVANSDWLDAVKANADTFDGDFNDGRIFRDGHAFVPGHTRVKVNAWYGSYNETTVSDTTVDPGPPSDCPALDCLEHE